MAGKARANARSICPRGETWVHVWSGETFEGGEVTVAAPLGQPPVFYRSASPFAGLFAGLRAL